MDSRYKIYHDSFTLSIQEVKTLAEKLGFTFDDTSIVDNDGEQLFNKVGIGPEKPRPGLTNRYSFELFKNNKAQKKFMHVQVYNRGLPTVHKNFELNAYIL